jgi:hypothetical protein
MTRKELNSYMYKLPLKWGGGKYIQKYKTYLKKAFKMATYVMINPIKCFKAPL